MNDIKYEQQQESDELDRKIAEIEHACSKRENEIQHLETGSLQQSDQIVTAIEAIGSIVEKVILQWKY